MTPKSRDPQPYLPLTPPMFHVLVALADGEKHGYAIMKEVEQRTAGSVTLSAGTLYGIIKRLVNDGMIEESRRRPAAARDDERRRYYRLTKPGRAALDAELERLDAIVRMARAAGALPRPAGGGSRGSRG